MPSVVSLPYAPSSVAVARRRLSAELIALGVLNSVVDDAAVVISELLSNALRHARPLPSGQVQVEWGWRGDVLRIAVRDGGSSTEPRRAQPTLSSLGGRGLGIVEALTHRWGVRYEENATTVWAILHMSRTVGECGAGDRTTGRNGRPVSGISHPTAPPGAPANRLRGIDVLHHTR